ncbi:MAG: ABC transporter ATP-binding protein [Anaerolineales bacterium]|nr:ABC transporter ATP-binding protein [Anaerolineales bacterium]
MELAIETKQLTKQYNSQPEDMFAIQGISLEVPRGQLFGLIGPDGAGKTTTIRILSTAMKPNSGYAKIGGFDVDSQPEDARLLIGYMPQAFSLYPDLTVIENLGFIADIQGVSGSRKKERIGELLAFSRLDRFQKRRSEHLSGGMRKKLALACALIHEPRVLLLDEPTTGVDPVSRRELWQIISDVLLLGVTVLVSTPYMDEAERCHKVGILNEGQILTMGSPKELTAQLPYQMMEIVARPRRITRQIINSTDGIIAWRPVGDRIRMAVEEPNKVEKKLRSAFKKNAGEIRILRQAKPIMDDVFIHLVESSGAENEV